ncbi:hypothetical protein ACVI1K_004569 [Bradyrhizobium sp. USDA 4508]
MGTQSITVDFECWSCHERTVKTVNVDTDNDTGGMNMRRRSIDVRCDNTKCLKTNSVDVHV